MKKVLIVVFSMIFLSVGFAGDFTRKIVKIDLAGQSEQTIEKLFKLEVDITQFSKTWDYVNALVTEAEMQQILDIGLKTTIVLSDADAFARRLRQTGYLEHFHSYDQMLQEMQDIAANYPGIAKLDSIGESYEKTVGRGGYIIWALKISDNVQVEEDEPEVFYFANMHAREIITPEIIMYFMRDLVDNYGTDPYITYLINNRQIWLSPTVNPDGHEYVFSGTSSFNRNDPMWWRKNKRDNNDNGVFEASKDGVDLNRNFGYKWGYDNSGSSPYPTSNTYRGTGPFSEPESQVVRDFVSEHNFIIALSFHSYSQLWLYPWAYKDAYTPDHETFVVLAESCVAYNNYDPERGVELYPVNGGTDDWFYGEQTTKNKVFGFTPEVGSSAEGFGGGFFPDTMYIEKQILENQGPMFYLAYAAGEEPIIEPQLYADTEDPVGPYNVTVKISPPIVLTQLAELDPALLKIYYNTTGTAPYDSTLLILTGQQNMYSGAIAGQGSGVTIYYYIAASDLLGRTGFVPRVAPVRLYSFKVGTDTIPPVLVHTPLYDQSVHKKSYSIKTVAADNVGIAEVMLYYRQNGLEIDSLKMNPTGAPNEYEAVIVPPAVEIGDVFEYRITATDISEDVNTAVEPATGFLVFQILGGFIFDFEPDDGGFVTISGSDWQWGIPTTGPLSAHSGSNVWATRLNANYNNLSDSWLDTPPIDFTAIAGATLIFEHWYLMEYSEETFWDGGNVKISVNEAPFEIIYPQHGYDGVIDDYNKVVGNEQAFGGPSENGNFWHREYFDLTRYVNNSVVIRFHFGSDGYTTEPGWYIDDVQILINETAAPIITNTTILPNTSDNVGPYTVQSTITGTGIASASLFYSTNAGTTFTEVGMADLGGNIYQGEIPGQPYATVINYYVHAKNVTDNITTDPKDAPGSTYCFLVTDRVPEISVTPADFNITIKQGESVADSMLIFNNGLLDLYFTVWDSLLSGSQISDELYSRSVKSFSQRKKAAGQFFESDNVGVPWIVEDPTRGVVKGEDSMFVKFTVNADSIAAGDYNIVIIFASNDPVTPEKIIPLNITVQPLTNVAEASTAQAIPTSFTVFQNYPNPFNPETIIKYELPKTSQIVLKVYNMLGQELKTLVNAKQPAGYYNVTWNGKDSSANLLPSGVYIFRIKAGDFVSAKKMILIR